MSAHSASLPKRVFLESNGEETPPGRVSAGADWSRDEEAPSRNWREKKKGSGLPECRQIGSRRRLKVAIAFLLLLLLPLLLPVSWGPHKTGLRTRVATLRMAGLQRAKTESVAGRYV